MAFGGATLIQPFDCESSTCSLQWDDWVVRLEQLFLINDVKEEDRRLAALMLLGLPRLSQIHKTLLTTTVTKTLEYDKAKERSSAYFKPKKNSVVEEYKFRSTRQHSGETIDQFSTRLRILSEGCKFHDVDREITTTIIQNCLSDKFRRVLLEVPDIKLDVVLKMGHVFDTVESNALFVEGKSIRDDVNYITRPIATPGKSCFTCGGIYPHKDGMCPAKSNKMQVVWKIGSLK
jgi:hypothetical protein